MQVLAGRVLHPLCRGSAVSTMVPAADVVYHYMSQKRYVQWAVIRFKIKEEVAEAQWQAAFELATADEFIIDKKGEVRHAEQSRPHGRIND